MWSNPKAKWLFFLFSLFSVVGMGLTWGKFRERDYLGGLYQRRDFTLLDDQGDFFRLGALPEKKLALLIFTPSGIPVSAVKPFFEFSSHIDDLRQKGIEPYLVSGVHKEILKNFKRATRFSSRILLDLSGVVGKNAGVRDGFQSTARWAYALVDRDFQVLWSASSDQPLEYSRLMEELNSRR